MNRIAACAALASLAAGAAHADPCKADLPAKAGASFSGIVRYVGDGDSLCVGQGAAGAGWIEVRLADFDAPELSTPPGRMAKDILAREVMGRQASCTVTKGRNGKTTTYDRVLAVCRVGGATIGDLLRRAGAPEGGR